MQPINIGVLLTCFNRKPKTLACLDALFHQSLPSDVTLTVYLVDDGSTDGTGNAIAQTYPQVKLFTGNGNLFWNGGMRFAFSEAMKDDPDYYLWLNDDTIIIRDAVKILLQVSQELAQKGEKDAIVSGSTRDPQTGQTTYGGVVRENAFHPFRYKLLEPNQEAQECGTVHGNCLLMPRSVVEKVGNLDPNFIHYLGDWDYGLRARQKDCTVWIAPGHLGTCSLNPQVTKVAASSLDEGLKKVNSPKGLAFSDVTLQSFDEWKVFTQRHGGIVWPIFWILPYRRLILLYVLNKLGLSHQEYKN